MFVFQSRTTDNLCTFPAPYVIGTLIRGNENLTQWREVFYLAAVLDISGSLIYILFASAEQQPWSIQRRSRLSGRNWFLVKTKISTSYIWTVFVKKTYNDKFCDKRSKETWRANVYLYTYKKKSPIIPHCHQKHTSFMYFLRQNKNRNI